MIIPTSRIVLLTGLVVLPASTLGTALASPVLLYLTGLVLFVFSLDALLSLRLAGDLQVRVPPISRLSEGREGVIPVVVINEKGSARRVRFSLMLPEEASPLKEDILLALPSGPSEQRVAWACRPRKRGRLRIERLCLGEVSPLGLWLRRASRAVEAEVRVYPALLRERRDLGALLARRGAAGVHALRQVGKGREFEKLREYAPGDSFEDIHWKATAKRSTPVTKVYQIERTQEIYVILDSSRLSARPAPLRGAGGEQRRVLDHFVDAALALAAAAEGQCDNFGLLAFDDRVRHFLRAGNSRRHHTACLDTLYTLQPRTTTPDFEELGSFIRLRLRRRALLIFLTSLDDPALAGGFIDSLELFRRQHLVMVTSLRPPHAMPLFSAPAAESLDDLYERLGGHVHWRRLRETGKVLQRRGVSFVEMENERLCPELITRYLDMKRRQLL